MCTSSLSCAGRSEAGSLPPCSSSYSGSHALPVITLAPLAALAPNHVGGILYLFCTPFPNVTAHSLRLSTIRFLRDANAAECLTVSELHARLSRRPEQPVCSERSLRIEVEM